MRKKFTAILAIMLLLMSCSLMLPAKVFASEIHVTADSFGKHPEKIHTLILGYEVTEIDDDAFIKLINLEEIKVDGKNRYFASSEGCLYNKNFTVLICVPQNTTSIPIRTSIISRTEHALDGLSQERIKNIDAFLNEKKGAKTEEPMYLKTPELSIPTTNTDFTQYVYKDKDGRQTFRYTGTGESTIVVPEGVEVIVGFTADIETLNYDITYVYLPKTLRMMMNLDMFNQAQFGYDKERYNALYSCPNLKSVEGGNFSYRANGSSVVRPGDITVWSNSSKIPFDLQKYIDVNEKLKR